MMETRRATRAILPLGGTMLRALPEESAVALSYNGSTQAVMMATPADLHDFAVGFTLTEALANPTEIDSIDVVETPQGIDLQVWLKSAAADRLTARRRTMAGPVGCGLCGIDSLAEATRAPAPLPASALTLAGQDIMSAMVALPAHQPLHDATRAAHAAGLWRPGHGFVAVREDVGRHNALDKLAGALLRAGENPGLGAVVLTSRVSLDMVQKTARLGAPILVAASAPTAAALDLAETLNLTVVALARPDRFEVFTHAARITLEGTADVA